MNDKTPRLVVIKTVEDIANYYDTIGSCFLMPKMSEIDYPLLNKVETNLLKIVNSPIVNSLDADKKKYVENLYCQCSELAMAKKYEINTTDRSFFAEITIFKDTLLNHPFKNLKNEY